MPTEGEQRTGELAWQAFRDGNPNRLAGMVDPIQTLTARVAEQAFIQGFLAGLSQANGVADTMVGKTLDEIEEYHIRKALELARGNRENAARMLGIGERTLYRKLKSYEARWQSESPTGE